MGDLEKYAQRSNSECSRATISLLFVAMAEQWPFFLERHTEQDVEASSIWISRYITAAALAGENQSTLRNVRDGMVRDTESTRASAKLRAALDNSARHLSDINQATLRRARSNAPRNEMSGLDPNEEQKRSLQQELDALAPSSEGNEHPGLNDWQRSDLTEAMSDGAIAQLVLCLCSSYREIRSQALINLRLCLSRLRDPQFSEREQIYLLLGEVAETAAETFNDRTLPSFAGSLTVQSISVLGDPSHIMFSKLNQFLSKSPSWNVSKLPSYWIDRIFLQPSEIDDGSAQEISWLLDVLIDGLRNETVSHDGAQCFFTTDV